MIHLVFILIILVSFGEVAFADTSWSNYNNEDSFNLITVDSYGKEVLDIGSVKQKPPLWNSNGSEISSSLNLEFNLADSWHQDQEKKNPNATEKKNGREIELDSDPFAEPVNVNLKGIDGKPDVSFTYLLKSNSFWLHSSCLNQGVDIQTKIEAQTAAVWISASCQIRNQEMEIHFNHAKNVTIKSVSTSTSVAEVPGGTQVLAPWGDSFDGITPPPVSVEVSVDGTKNSEHEITFKKARLFQRKLSVLPELQIAYRNYQEPGNYVAIYQGSIDLAVKIMYYNLIRNLLTVEGQGNITLAPFLVASGKNGFWNLNARLDGFYPIPIHWFRGKWEVGLGYQWWKMWVPNATYGVGLALAPELTLRFQSLLTQFHPYSIFVRYALFQSSQTAFQTSNFDLNTGITFQVGTIGQFPMILTSMLQWSQFNFGDGYNQLSLFSSLLGIQTQF